ncbi:MAG: PadR family transcriptional regulator [Firmicutes bacterium]|nr:PadR family transcriptional regulator [Bacillota bacterium]
MKAKTEDNKRDILENFEAQFKKSTLPLMVLKILSEREMYAYEITQIAYERSKGKYKMPLLYTTLRKLQEQGFVVESKKVVSKDNRVRIYYKLTDDGLVYLENIKSMYLDLTAKVHSIVYDEN